MKNALLTLLPALLALFLFSCQEEGVRVSTSADPVDTSIYLQCKGVSQPGDVIPHHEVFVVLGENIVKVADIYACDKIEPARYESLGIPASALDALGSTDAVEGGMIVFVDRAPDRRIQVRVGVPETEAPDSKYKFRTMATFTDEVFSGNPERMRAELVGTYALSGQKNSYVLFLGLSNMDMIAQFFEVQGPLPEVAKMGEVLTKAPPVVFKKFSVNFRTLEFESDYGTGMIDKTDEKTVITFRQKTDENGQPLRLEKIITN